ncbi:2-oxo-4-hydroxy-4-carboxy-5-ureidoimidazoline decarboxylase [Leucothrix pacifica]|uniref:2-oxo-4-hydroxy-4-carboxy-5-ureidoimidazoline decarboxylase n=1 Tax=Leucothrix pacifica TaxID=1247513 RepID=A0A317CHF8_9GAMM|nr:2-oxo-4-hydroxy-4-carboxy-5-ureidoimidazoline decarboxylase [Leucothrix pacifica]PWQ97799.1 2-oxo-4-hydroxy-4-carboxy-5-ureidoimidazoline decarboxylase [Leucothrix pacifica]
MSRDEFVKHFGGIYEHSAWVAEQAYDHASSGLNDIDSLTQSLRDVVDAASHEQQLALLRAHPDLAGKAALQGELTDASTSEQAGAGLDQCTPEELECFKHFNESYLSRFDFPFIMAVKGANRHLILAAFEKRLTNSRDVEFKTALEEVHKIAGFRLAAWFEEEHS